MSARRPFDPEDRAREALAGCVVHLDDVADVARRFANWTERGRMYEGEAVRALRAMALRPLNTHREDRAIRQALELGREDGRNGVTPPGWSHPSTLVIVSDMEAAMTRAIWPKPGDKTRRRLIEVFLEHAAEVGTTQLDMSVRQWAELAGVDHTTVARWCRSLAPWVIPVRNYHPYSGKAMTWTIGCTPTGQRRNRPRSNPQVGDAATLPARWSTGHPAQDVWCGKESARTVYNLIDFDGNAPFGVTDLVQASGLHRKTVATALRYLAEYKFVTSVSSRRWQPDLRDGDRDALDQIPRYGDERRKSNDRDRQQHRLEIRLAGPEPHGCDPGTRCLTSDRRATETEVAGHGHHGGSTAA